MFSFVIQLTNDSVSLQNISDLVKKEIQCSEHQCLNRLVVDTWATNVA